GKEPFSRINNPLQILEFESYREHPNPKYSCDTFHEEASIYNPKKYVFFR
ncbi:9798_t:CDS:1, partial [Gigaspora rosea]